ncbi:MAG: MFS transporter [Gammaproteobacteria bacterium]|nr:MFS transporter [Gammaproteobacteria bacterium]
MRTLISFAALFLSVALLQLSSGAISPLDALGGLKSGFSTTEVGLLGSAHFVGFFIGCWLAPRLIGTIGHSRTFATFAACGAIGAVGHPLLIDPTIWAGLRVLTGFCVAGCYTVVEAWLQERVTNENRGRVLGVYRSVDLGASLMAQLMISVLEPAHYIAYNVLTILCCASLLPLVVTRVQPPQSSVAPRLSPLKTFRVSPLGACGVAVAGITAASFRMVGPVYGQQLGLVTTEIAYFLAAFVLGGALAQVPVGWLADRYDRRWVLIIVSMLSVVACAGTVLFGNDSQTSIFISALLFGGVTFPVFSLSAAHANDFSEPGQAVELNASLMFIYGVGAIASPLFSSYLMQISGPAMLFVMIACAHLALAIFGFYRMIAGPQAEIRRPYRYLPRTSFVLSRLLRRAQKHE